MRILVVGASGRLGSAVVRALGPQGLGHDIVTASRSGAVAVDLTDPSSIERMYIEIGEVDAVACCAGSAPMKPLAEMTAEDLQAACSNKLLGQLELVRRGIPHVRDGGSFTLVSGITSVDPVPRGSLLSMVNGAIDGFVVGAAIDLPRGLRINSVSATLFEETAQSYAPAFPGFVPVSTSVIAQAYVKSVLSGQTGQVYRIGY